MTEPSQTSLAQPSLVLAPNWWWRVGAHKPNHTAVGKQERPLPPIQENLDDRERSLSIESQSAEGVKMSV